MMRSVAKNDYKKSLFKLWSLRVQWSELAGAGRSAAAAGSPHGRGLLGFSLSEHSEPRASGSRHRRNR